MARALLVGCGCRGRELGAGLLGAGWQVRGTTRDPGMAAAIEAVGIEPAVADPGRLVTVLDQVADATLVFWLLGSAAGERAAIEPLHGARLARFLEQIIDSPVRGFVYEAAGTAGPALIERGSRIVSEAGERWRIPFELVDAQPAEWGAWRRRMLAAAERLTGERAGRA